MRGDSGGRHVDSAHLVLAVVSTLATLAGVVVALVATDTIVISASGDTTTTEVTVPPRTVTATVTETVTAVPPLAKGGEAGGCNQEPNDDRISATLVSLGACEAVLETQNDRDWFLFETPRGGQFELVVQKEETEEESGTIIVVIYEGSNQIEDEHVAADEPFTLRQTLQPGAELAVEIVDGCGPPGGCGLGGYSLELRAL